MILTKIENGKNKQFLIEEMLPQDDIQAKKEKLMQEIKRIPYKEGAFFCKTQEDFFLVLEYDAYNHMTYDWINRCDKPSYDYDKNGYKGEDWYFLERYLYSPKEKELCRIVTLQEKKDAWENYCKQFAI